MPPQPLQTPRLTLRPYTLADIPALLPLIGAREVAATTLRIPHPYTEELAREFIANSETDFEKGICERFCIVIRESNTLCGGIGLQLDSDHLRAELGYWIGVPFWRNGYATEAAAAIVKHGFEQLNLHRIFASYVKSNVASGNVLRKIGMTYEGRHRGHIQKWGVFHDLEMYGMLAADFMSRQAATAAQA